MRMRMRVRMRMRMRMRMRIENENENETKNENENENNKILLQRMAQFKGKLSIPSRRALPLKALPRKRKTTETTKEEEPTSFPRSLCR